MYQPWILTTLLVSHAAAQKGQWGPIIKFPLVPAAAFLMHDSGNVLTFSSFQYNQFDSGGMRGQTATAIWNANSGAVSEMTVTNTKHDMFCPGMSFDFNGNAIITGGDDYQKTSSYNPSTGQWTAEAEMKIGRGYQASATCSDGRIFTIGGSWNGGRGDKNGEIYDVARNTWTLLPGCPVAPMLTNDQDGIFRQDSHAWLFGWKEGTVFQAGPSSAMNWYSTAGNGGQKSAGKRASDPDSMDGNAVMYDAANGKIVTMGGSPSYENCDATANVHLITLGAANGAVNVKKLTSMHHARAFANAVVLPDGTVFVTGGQTHPITFTDTTAIYEPELWDPETQQFTVQPPHQKPRTYHSIALLLQDGRVFTGGGGLCGESCAVNHDDAEIYSPAYLFDASGQAAARPKIMSVSAKSMKAGATFTATTDSAVTSWSLCRYSTTTHTVDTDQRRVALTAKAAGNTYTMTLPGDTGVLLGGYWMLFAMNDAGTPSVAYTVKITL